MISNEPWGEVHKRAAGRGVPFLIDICSAPGCKAGVQGLATAVP